MKHALTLGIPLKRINLVGFEERGLSFSLRLANRYNDNARVSARIAERIVFAEVACGAAQVAIVGVAAVTAPVVTCTAGGSARDAVFYDADCSARSWSPWVGGPGAIHLNMSGRRVRDGYQSVGHPPFMSKDVGSAWVQSININGVGVVCAQIVGRLRIKDVTVESHKDLGGVIIHVFLNAPGAWSSVRLGVYVGERVVYDVSKTVGIPGEYARSPCVDLRVDFGPIFLKKSSTYTVKVDGASDGEAENKAVHPSQ